MTPRLPKVILYIATSLDGYIARPDGAVDWLDAFMGEDYGYKEFANQIGSVVMGYGTYDKSLSFGDAAFAKGKDYYVATRLHQDEELAHATIVEGELEHFIRGLKKRSEKDIWLMGGGQLITAFMDLKLIDEMMIFVMPLILGAGIPLFPTSSPEVSLSLKTVQSYANGVVLMHYTC